MELSISFKLCVGVRMKNIVKSIWGSAVINYWDWIFLKVHFNLTHTFFIQCTKPHQAHWNHHFWIIIFRRIFNLIALHNNLIGSRKKMWGDKVVTGFTLIFCICGHKKWKQFCDNFFLFFKCVVSHIILSQSCHNMS